MTGVQTCALPISGVFGKLQDKMPGSENDTPELISLGKKLYFETHLSAKNTQSCNTCHNVEGKGAGVDNKPTSTGAFGKNGTRNSPTVLNAGFQFIQFWDGRAKDLVEQAKGPILNPVEMGIKTEKEALNAIEAIPEYKELFVKAFPNDKTPLNFNNIAIAIAAFERTLVSKSRFDQFIAGNVGALKPEEVSGIKTFINTGCTVCHLGSMIGGSMYQKMGLVNACENQKDLGRFDITKNEADKFFFKVPTLRNIALTAPYFHDGAVAKLEDAVTKMAWMELGKKLTPEETGSIVAFLNTLNGLDKN